MKTNRGLSVPLVAAGLLWILLGAMAPTASATAIFSGVGIGTDGFPIAGTAAFEFVTYDFGSGSVNAVKITLTNNASSTTRRGNLITGLFFSLSGGVGPLPTTSAGFDGRAPMVVLSDGTIATNVDIAPAVNRTATDGGYQLSNGPFGLAESGDDFSAFGYGISTVGLGLTGFNGAALNGGGGESDYGVFAIGSNVSSGGLASARPLVDTSALFWIARPSGWTSEGQVARVRITYGTSPENTIDIPEPTSLTLLGAGLFGLAFLRRQRA